MFFRNGPPTLFALAFGTCKRHFSLKTLISVKHTEIDQVHEQNKTVVKGDGMNE